jgi:hypothetical protein
MTQHTNLITRMARRTAGMLAEIRRAQHRMDEILTNPTGE